VGRFEDEPQKERADGERGGRVEKDAGLKIRQCKDKAKTAGLKPHTYEGAEKTGEKKMRG
jgi:hypothetical protein